MLRKDPGSGGMRETGNSKIPKKQKSWNIEKLAGRERIVHTEPCRSICIQAEVTSSSTESRGKESHCLLSVCLPIYHLSVCLSIYLSIYPPTYPGTISHLTASEPMSSCLYNKLFIHSALFPTPLRFRKVLNSETRLILSAFEEDQ